MPNNTLGTHVVSDAALRDSAVRATALYMNADGRMGYMRTVYPAIYWDVTDNRLATALRAVDGITQAEFNAIISGTLNTLENTANNDTSADDDDDSNMRECDGCGTLRNADTVDFHSVESGEEVCAVCAQRHYIYSGMQDIYVLRNDIVRLDSGDIVSSEYAEHNCYRSEESGEWFAYEEERDEYDRRNSPRAVYGYHDTTPQEAHGGWPRETPRNSLCFGVELEMEHADDEYGQSELADALGGRDGDTGRYILMSDGSLNESGVELITQPYTLDYHQKTFGWDKLLARVAKIGRSGKGTEACGMHVHVNRRALSALTLGKMLVFVNSPNNTRLIETIAQRNPEEWARRYAKSVKHGRDTDSDKYEAMHLSSRTVEFRIFRGNLRPDRVLKNIEFCHAVWAFAKDSSMKDLEIPTLFVTWLAKNKGTYPNLSKFLSEKSFTQRLAKAANAGKDARPSTAVTITEEI